MVHLIQVNQEPTTDLSESPRSTERSVRTMEPPPSTFPPRRVQAEAEVVTSTCTLRHRSQWVLTIDTVNVVGGKLYRQCPVGPKLPPLFVGVCYPPRGFRRTQVTWVEVSVADKDVSLG